MDEKFIFQIDDLFVINNMHIATGELANDIETGIKIIVLSDDMTAYGLVTKIQIFEKKSPVDVSSACKGQPVGLWLKLPEDFPIKKSMFIYRDN
tara:strand:- start:986 stop:1267 length:282 start_codon:yes stop_codon:yes gene_type:complete